MLWQLPPRLAFDVDRLAGFFNSLPRSTAEAAELARGHDDRLKAEPFTEVDVDRPVRHALEVRHPSFATAECVELLREHIVGPPAPRRPRDVYVYFDNDVKAHAPHDAMALAELLGTGPASRTRNTAL
ncbi:MAG: DUF72 domain-containing protein [Actinophytocola sp.]|nr:DUF72 domain-containing protein [Actinophytocola sp.]